MREDKQDLALADCRRGVRAVEIMMNRDRINYVALSIAVGGPARRGGSIQAHLCVQGRGLLLSEHSQPEGFRKLLVMIGIGYNIIYPIN